MITTTEPTTKTKSGPLAEETSEAREAVAETGRKAKTEANEVFAKLRQGARHQADTCVDATAGKIRNLEQAATTAADEMTGEQPDFLVAGMNLAAERIASVADYFERHDSGAIAEDVADQVRKRPGTTLGALALIGFCAGRFVKAGHPEKPEGES